MSGLILKLSPKERLLINGAVVENGDRRARLSILTAGANILRLRDAGQHVGALERALIAGDAAAAEASWKLVAASCKDCHAAHRNE